jgi:putative NADH-flavin reductase
MKAIDAREEPPTVLLLGGTGRTGRLVLTQLLERGVNVRAIVRSAHRLADPFVEWVAVRPDSLLDGPVTEYSLHDSLVSSLFRPDSTNRANVAHFMCELVQKPQVWDKRKCGLPVVANAASRAH